MNQIFVFTAFNRLDLLHNTQVLWFLCSQKSSIKSCRIVQLKIIFHCFSHFKVERFTFAVHSVTEVFTQRFSKLREDRSNGCEGPKTAVFMACKGTRVRKQQVYLMPRFHFICPN